MDPNLEKCEGTPAGCGYYSRNYWIEKNCCQCYHPCKNIYDELETNNINFFFVKHVAYFKYGVAVQPVPERCGTCIVQCIHFFCAKCTFHDNRAGKSAYYCKTCWICQCRKGIDLENYISGRCGNSVLLDVIDLDPCRKRNMDANCPICILHLTTRMDQNVFIRFGQKMHLKYLEQHAKTGSTRRKCHKAMPVSMTEYYWQRDEKLWQNMIPLKYANKISWVTCYGCERKTEVSLTFRTTSVEGYAAEDTTRGCWSRTVETSKVEEPLLMSPKKVSWQVCCTQTQTGNSGMQKLWHRHHYYFAIDDCTVL